MYFWKYILAKKAGLSQKKCNMALYGLPVLPIAEAFEKTVTGNPISVTDALAQDALSLQVSFTPTQDGTPSIDSEPTTEPYLSKVIPRGNKEYYSLVGATVAWNQLVDSDFFTGATVENCTCSVSDGVTTITATVTGVAQPIRKEFDKVTLNHVYFTTCAVKSDTNGVKAGISASNMSVNINTLIPLFATTTSWSVKEGIGKVTAGNYNFLRIGTASNASLAVGDSLQVKDFNFIDLTLMFANEPAIADYVYTLEQSEAGSGIAWLKSYGFFSKIHYAPNTGELISVNTSGKKIVGFNQWDEIVELGGIDNTNGQNYVNNNLYRSKNYIPIINGVDYYFCVKNSYTIGARYYDINKNFISSRAIIGESRLLEYGTMNLPTGTAYMRFTNLSTNIYHDDICINISDPQKNGTYKPYVTNTYPIDPTDLRGLFKLSNGKLTCDGDIYPPSGSVERKYSAPIDLGALDWSTTSASNVYATTNEISDMVRARADGTPQLDIICQKYAATPVITLAVNVPDKMCSINVLGKKLMIKDSTYATAGDLKTALSGTYFVYPLETPTTESATPYTSPIDVEAGGTEEFIDNRTVPIPVGNETYYASEYAVHGKTGVTVSHGATEDDPNPTEYEIEFTSQGTVYGGTVDIVSGVLSMTWGYIASYNGESLTGEWMSSKDVYAEGTTPSTGAEVAYELAAPQTYNLTPEQVQMLLNDNYLETSDGMITLTYMAGK